MSFKLLRSQVLKRHGTPELTAAVAAAATAAPAAGALQPMQEDPAAHLFMKKLLTWEATSSPAEQVSASTEQSSSTSFAQALLQRLGNGSGGLLHWCSSNRGAFVVTALLGVPSVTAAVQKKLASHLGALKKLAAQGSKGAEVLYCIRQLYCYDHMFISCMRSCMYK
jgi:hypothetical protein